MALAYRTLENQDHMTSRLDTDEFRWNVPLSQKTPTNLFELNFLLIFDSFVVCNYGQVFYHFGLWVGSKDVDSKSES